MNKIPRFALYVLIFGYTFLYAPVLLLSVYAFSDSRALGVWSKFSLKWFKVLFEDREFGLALLNSLKVAISSSTIALILGTLSSVSVTKFGYSATSKFLKKIAKLPAAVPDIVVGFSLLFLFVTLERTIGFPGGRGLLTITVGHVMVSVAYVHITISSRIESFDRTIEEAAMDLGAYPMSVVFLVILPAIKGTLFASWLLAFALSFDDVVVSSFLSGPGVTTLPVLIFSNIRIGCSPEWNALAALSVVLGIGMIFLVQYMTLKPTHRRVKRPSPF
jgi:putrescine transport system permease protein